MDRSIEQILEHESDVNKDLRDNLDIYGIDFNVVMQRENWDCGLASISTILQKDYDLVRSEFMSNNKRIWRGLSYKGVCEYLQRNGKTISLTQKKNIDFKDIVKIERKDNTFYIAILNSLKHKESHIVVLYNDVLLCSLFGHYLIDEIDEYTQEYLDDMGCDMIKYITQVS